MNVDNIGSWVTVAENGTANLTAAASIQVKTQNTSVQMDPWEDVQSTEVTRLENSYFKAYRDFATTAQILILIGSLLGNATVLWCACYTNVFRSVTGRFIKNLACSGICAALVCVPFDVALGARPHCCWWLHGLFLCKAVKFLHRLFCSVTVLSFTAIALDRYYSVLYPLERKISDAKSRDLVIYIWVHAVVASVPVLVVTNVTDIYATSSCSDAPSHSLGHLVYVVAYNITTVILPLAAVFLAMVLIRRALSASQKKKVIIAALRTPQNCISIPYVSQREAELHATLLAAVLAFTLCGAPYAVLVVYQVLVLGAEATGGEGVAATAATVTAAAPAALWLTAAWLPKLSLLTNPLLFLTVNRSARRCLSDALARAHRRCSRRNAVGSAGLGEMGGAGGGGADGGGLGGEAAARSGSQLLEMFNIGQQQIFRPSEEEEEDEEEEEEEDDGRHEIPSVGSGASQRRVDEAAAGSRRGAGSVGPEPTQQQQQQQQQQLHQGAREVGLSLPKPSPLHACAYSSSQVAPATPTDLEEATQFGFGPFELPPQWLPETRNSKRRLLPPLGNTPEELIQTKQPRPRPERRISRNNKVSTFPTVDP